MVTRSPLGDVYELSHTLHARTLHGPVSAAFERTLAHPHAPFDDAVAINESTIYSGSDEIEMGTHTGTHVDATLHVTRGGRTWDDAHPDLAPGPRAVLSRGVLLDLPTHLGVECVREPVTRALIEDCTAAQGVALQRGDAVLIRTGKDRLAADEAQFLADPHGGPDVGAARFLADAGASIVGSDTMPFEAAPSDAPLEVHAVFLVDHGIQIMEMLDLSELSTAGVHEFVFVLAPLRIAGGTGSPVNPLAIVPRTGLLTTP